MVFISFDHHYILWYDTVVIDFCASHNEINMHTLSKMESSVRSAAMKNGSLLALFSCQKKGDTT